MVSPRPRSGAQFTLRADGYVAVIASVGATLRVLRIEDRDLVVPFDADEVRPAYRGATLAPWPNRVIDGVYRFGGEEHRLALTETARGHALHGLALWLDYMVEAVEPDRVTLVAVIEPQAGYPWRIAVRTSFVLSAAGLTQTVTAENLSAEPAPWGTGPHPYLVAGPGRVDDWTLELPARRIAITEGERLLPAGVVEAAAVDAVRFDFVHPRPIDDAEIDHAYTGMIRDASGVAKVRVTAGSGSELTGVEMTWDERCPWVQVHTADRPGDAEDRIGLAVEPMTCPPDAFNSREDLIVLAPGAVSSAAWTISAISAG